MTTSEIRTLALAIQQRMNAMSAELTPACTAAAGWVLNADDASLPTIAEVKAVYQAYDAFDKPAISLYSEIRTLKTTTDAAAELPTGAAAASWETLTGKPETYPADWNNIIYKPSTFPTSWEEISGKPTSFGVSFPEGAIMLWVEGVEKWLWLTCDGREIDRMATPLGTWLTWKGCPYGAGDGSNTVNIPNMAAPSGFVYKIYTGQFA